MNLPKYEILIEYCDKCAKKYNYPITQEKVKETCKLCGRMGRINQVLQNTIVDFKNFNESSWKGGGFDVDQLIPFPIGQTKETLHPTMPYKILTEKLTLYFDKNEVILGNYKTGQQIRIKIS